MKQVKFLSAVIAFVLVITIIGCTTTRSGEYYDMPQASGQFYTNNPYYYSYRDPFAGGYYQTVPYGGYYTYDRRYQGHERNYDNDDRRGYNNKERGYDNRQKDSRRENNTRYRQVLPQPQPPVGRDGSRDEARKKILGN